MFKKNARAILGCQKVDEFCENFDYKQQSVTDIVTAYKSLKQLLVKA